MPNFSCPSCRTRYAAENETEGQRYACEACGHKFRIAFAAPLLTPTQKKWLGIILGVFVLLFIAWLFDTPEKRAERAAKRAEREAKSQEESKLRDKQLRELALLPKAHDAVRARLRAPATAEFVGEPRIKYHDDGTCTVYGEVDAKNALGVPLRADWYVIFKNDEPINAMVVERK